MEANEDSVDINIIPDLFLPTALFLFTVSVNGMDSISNINPLYVPSFSVDAAINSLSYTVLIESDMPVKLAFGSHNVIKISNLSNKSTHLTIVDCTVANAGDTWAAVILRGGMFGVPSGLKVTVSAIVVKSLTADTTAPGISGIAFAAWLIVKLAPLNILINVSKISANEAPKLTLTVNVSNILPVLFR